MTRDDEIATLAALVADIAQRCWVQLGTDEVVRITVSAIAIVESAQHRASEAAMDTPHA